MFHSGRLHDVLVCKTVFLGADVFMSHRHTCIYPCYIFITLCSSLWVAGGVTASIKSMAQDYSKAIGLMPELPDWVYNGVIMGVQGGTDKVTS